MSQISALTATQSERIQTYRDRWWQYLTATQPLNRVDAEMAVARAYEAAGLKTPRI